MNFNYSDDPIIACSTGGNTNTAIAVIRISGVNIEEVVNPFFSIDTTNLKPRYATFCKILDNDKIVDEIVLTFFKGPNSYNGEDVFELSVHGNVLNIKRIIDLFISNTGIRFSNPGEFTYRALKNKKLTLNQVEGLDLLLNANSIFALDQGFSLLSGQLQKDFTKLYDLFLNHRSSIEMGFDFLDDVGEEQFESNLKGSFVNLKSHIDKLYKHVKNTNSDLLNPEIVILGLPNAGKSSLFNNLLTEDRAIVSNIAGTTRDYITESLNIDNNIFKLTDTAGIRNTEDKIEELGVHKALDLIETSFFKILVVNPFDIDSKYFSKIENVKFDLIIFTHSDKEGFVGERDDFKNNFSHFFVDSVEIKTAGSIEPKNIAPIGAEKSGSIEPENVGPIGAEKPGSIEPKNVGPIGAYTFNYSNVCATETDNELICSVISAKYMKLLDFDPLIVSRHSYNIEKIKNMFNDYEAIFNNCSDDISIIASELNIVGHCISELIGIISPDDILHNIFDNFCIGK